MTYTRKVDAIDVSAYQHPNGHAIDWAKVRAGGIRACLIKATEATDYVNPWLDRDSHGAHREGLAVGYYHYAWPSWGPPEAQVKFFAEHVASLPRDLCVMLDLEEQAGLSWLEVSDWGRAWCDAFIGREATIVLYANRNFLSNMPAAPWGHKLLFADPGAPRLVRPRRNIWGWQHSWDGSVPGIAGAVDLDELFIEC